MQGSRGVNGTSLATRTRPGCGRGVGDGEGEGEADGEGLAVVAGEDAAVGLAAATGLGVAVDDGPVQEISGKAIASATSAPFRRLASGRIAGS